jgi:hypothetical protein
MPAPTIVQIIVTGICAIIPSAKDKEVTRIIAPNGMHMAMLPQNVPQHFPFIEVREKNLLAEDANRQRDFTYHNDADPPGVDRAVFILASEEIKLETAPTNTTKTVNDTPRGNETVPTSLSEEEKTTIRYQLNVPVVCSKCGPIRNEFFDVTEKARDNVALRMDLRGGRQRVTQPDFKKLWQFPQNAAFKPQPVAQEVVFAFDVPAEIERIKLRRFADDNPTQIALFSPDGQPIDVTVGNAPVHDILNLASNEPQHQRDDHWALLYRMFKTPPPDLPLPTRVPTPIVSRRGVNDDCIPGGAGSQDPNP